MEIGGDLSNSSSVGEMMSTFLPSNSFTTSPNADRRILRSLSTTRISVAMNFSQNVESFRIPHSLLQHLVSFEIPLAGSILDPHRRHVKKVSSLKTAAIFGSIKVVHSGSIAGGSTAVTTPSSCSIRSTLLPSQHMAIYLIFSYSIIRKFVSR